MKPTLDARFVVLYSIIFMAIGHATWNSWSTTLTKKAISEKEFQKLKAERDSFQTAYDKEKAITKNMDRLLNARADEIEKIKQEVEDAKEKAREFEAAQKSSIQNDILTVENLTIDAQNLVEQKKYTSNGVVWHLATGRKSEQLLIGLATENKSPIDALQKTINSIRSNERYTSISQPQRFDFKGHEASLAEFEDFQDGHLIHKTIIYVKNGGSLYKIASWSDKADWPDLSSEIQARLQSIEIK